MQILSRPRPSEKRRRKPFAGRGAGPVGGAPGPGIVGTALVPEPSLGRRRAEPRLPRIVTGRPASDAGQGSGLSRRARCRLLARTVFPAPNALPVLGGVAQLGCLSRQTTPDTCLIQQSVDLLGGGEGTVSQQCPRHAAPKRADRRRTPTWCEIVSTLAAVAGGLINLIQLLRG